MIRVLSLLALHKSFGYIFQVDEYTFSLGYNINRTSAMTSQLHLLRVPILFVKEFCANLVVTSMLTTEKLCVNEKSADKDHFDRVKNVEVTSGCVEARLVDKCLTNAYQIMKILTPEFTLRAMLK